MVRLVQSSHMTSDWSDCCLDLVLSRAGAADVQAVLGGDHGGLVQQLCEPHQSREGPAGMVEQSTVHDPSQTQSCDMWGTGP